MTGGPSETRVLTLWEQYDRRDVHTIFRESKPFQPQAGPWGVWGILKLSNHPGDFVFFVTFRASDPKNQFEEHISQSGALTWQSQKRSRLRNSAIQRLIRHDELVNNVYLFLRTKPRRPYTYLGRLGYISHDIEREMPVWMRWQLLDWPIPQRVLESLQLSLAPDDTEHAVDSGKLIVSAPPPRDRIPGDTYETLRARVASPRMPEDQARRLGLLGEQLVLQHERSALRAAGRPDLAERVEHIAITQGDGAGYDIISYSLDGSGKYIEVKTTSGDDRTPFEVTPNELAASRRLSSQYVLARVFRFDSISMSGVVYFLEGPIDEHFALTASSYRASR